MRKIEGLNSHTQAAKRYNEKNYEVVRFIVPAGEKNKIKQAAEQEKISLTQYVIKAINEYRRSKGLEAIKEKISDS